MSKLRSQLNNFRTQNTARDANRPIGQIPADPQSPARPRRSLHTQNYSFLGDTPKPSPTIAPSQSNLDTGYAQRTANAQRNRQELDQVKASIRELSDILTKAQQKPAPAQPPQHHTQEVKIDSQELASELSDSISTSLSGSLQTYLREQLSAEIKSMRSELSSLHESASRASDREVLEDIKRISQGIHDLQNRQVVNPQQFSEIVGDLRSMHADIRSISEQKPEPLDTAEITQSIQNSYDEIAKRLDKIGTSQSSTKIDSLNDKLEHIRKSLPHTDPETLFRIEGQLQTLGDGISTLAASIESNPQSRADNTATLNNSLSEYFDNLERRMDEITRAVMATAQNNQLPGDEAAFDRIEARINSLAKTIENLVPAHDVINQNPQLSELMQVPEQLQNTMAVLDRLEERVAHNHIQPTTDTSGPNEEFGGLIASLTQKIDQLQLAATRQTDTSLGEEIAVKLDAMTQTLERAMNSDDGTIEQLQSQITQLSDRLETALKLDQDEQQNRLHHDDRIFQEIQALATRIEQIDHHQPEAEPHNLQLSELQNQIAGITSQLQSFNTAPDLGIIEQRLGGIENQHTNISTLAKDLKSLSDSSSELKGHSLETFDAVRQSLAMILDRINGIEVQIADTESTSRLAPAASPEPDHDHLTTHSASMVRAAREYASNLDSNQQTSSEQDFSDPELHNPAFLNAQTSQTISDDAQPAFEDQSGSPQVPTLDAPSLEIENLPESPKPPLAGNFPEGGDDHAANHNTNLQGNGLPLAPGSGAPVLSSRTNGPDMDALMRQAKDNKRKQTLEEEQQNPTDFIAAARRAAQAAASEAEAMNLAQAKTKPAKESGPSLVSRLKSHKKQLMFGAAAVLLAVAAVPAFNFFKAPSTTNTEQTASVDPVNSETSLPQDLNEQPPVDVKTTPQKLAELPKTREIKIPSPTSEAPATPEIVKTENVLASTQPAPASIADPVREPMMAPTNKPVTMAPMPPAEIGSIILRQAAASGDPKAMFEVGRRYTTGINGKPDFAEAVKWYQRAADANFAPAQYRLGNFYEKGHGLTSDADKAAKWYERAANQGNALAMHNLAVINAMGVLKSGTNMSEAAKWFENAAEHGVKDSQVNLGIVYAKAMGVDVNLTKAYKWFSIAAKAGDNDAAHKRDTIAKQMRPDQLEQARGEVALWKPKNLNTEANNVEIPAEWKASPQVTASLTNGQMIKNAQSMLKKLGFKPGPADGKMGARTTSAIKRFQSKAGIARNGKVSMELINALERAVR